MPTSGSFVQSWAKAQQSQAHSSKNAPVFYRNLEAELDTLRQNQRCLGLHNYTGLGKDMIDFASADMLGLGSSGKMRSAFMEELVKSPDWWVSASGPRLTFGNSKYMEDLEHDIALFHGAETALMAVNGGMANGAIFTAIPRPGDALVYDEFIHASVHDGMKNSLALCKKSFRHNSVDSFRETLETVRNSQPLIHNGARCVIIAVEGIYSMDGDVCPLQELVNTAKEIFPSGNAQFVIDEAHSHGVIGPKGAGLVSALGLEKEIAIRMHTLPKAMGAGGAVIMCNNTVRNMLLNFGRNILFSGAPGFPLLAAIRVGYDFLKSGQTQQAQDRIKYMAELFKQKMTAHPVWETANDAKILRVPLWDQDEQEQRFWTPICPILTRPNTKHNVFLAFHLQLNGFIAYPVYFPVVPKSAERVRIIFHASNTDEQIEALATSVCCWAEEMLEIDEEGAEGERLPTAARQAYAILMKEGLNASA
ncbi:hypothetical protein DL769_000150 [Monosporascus sp. CRB-8-3]|nr:hypothetical protein DL769_000150 [Monosporascus sp. CRB-8-3]